MKDIFVPALKEWQRAELQTVENADQYRFHSLLTFEELVEHPPGFEELLTRARRQLEEFEGKPDAIICHWDFPSSCLTPILAREYNLRAPSLESVVRCEHKYWARLEQHRSAPECIPAFQALDPFDDKAVETFRLDYPIWLKPVKAYSSILGFYIENEEELRKALAEMRDHIRELGALFDECLKYVELPPGVEAIGGRHAIAESIMRGEQFACEGYVCNNEVHFLGFLDMLREQEGKEIIGLRYPADLDPGLQARAEDVARRVLDQVEFNDGCFNVEYLWDAPNDQLWVLEVNTRMSQSHSDLFRKVDGVSDHQAAIDVALGKTPQLHHYRGEYRTSAKFLLNKIDDAHVTRVPTDEELKTISEELGDALIVIDVHEGGRLSDLVHQGKYSFTVGEAWIGANSEDELMEKYQYLLKELPLEFSDGRNLAREKVAPPQTMKAGPVSPEHAQR